MNKYVVEVRRMVKYDKILHGLSPVWVDGEVCCKRKTFPFLWLAKLYAYWNDYSFFTSIAFHYTDIKVTKNGD